MNNNSPDGLVTHTHVECLLHYIDYQPFQAPEAHTFLVTKGTATAATVEIVNSESRILLLIM